MEKLSYSVIICTRNRRDYLRDALVSACNQDYPLSYEVIVVDNGSTDGTDELVKSQMARFGNRIRYVSEPKTGLSQARNTGAAIARGDILVYLDDDAIATESWLNALDEAFALAPATVLGAAGGKVELKWETGPRPAWLAPELEGYLSGTTFAGDHCRALQPGEYPVGANFSVRREHLAEVGGFATDLGRAGRNLISNEEVDLCRRLWKAGFEIWYVPHAMVYHRVLPQRATRRYLLARAYWQGVSDAVLVYSLGSLEGWSWKALLRLIRDLSRYLLLSARRMAAGNRPAAFAQVCYASSRLGYSRYQMGLAFRKP